MVNFIATGTKLELLSDGDPHTFDGGPLAVQTRHLSWQVADTVPDGAARSEVSTAL